MRYIRDATVDHVVDGDTVALLIDMGWQLFARYSCRLVLDPNTSIDTPEHGQPGFAEAVNAAKKLLPAGTAVVCESLRMIDKYGGRFDGSIWLPDGRSFAEAMLIGGWAKKWQAGAPKPFPRAGT